MFSVFIWPILFLAFNLITDETQGTCGRHVKFTTEKYGYALHGHVIKNLSLQVGQTRDPCRGQCVMERRCVSINTGPPINDRIVCELSDSDNSLHPEDLKPRVGFTYIGTENLCSSSPCLNNGTCQAGFTSKGFRCICHAGFSGTNCHEALPAAKSCKELYEENKSRVSELVTLQFDTKPTSVFCHFGDFGCGDGGWTPVMKTDGDKSTFHYGSEYWSDKNEYNLQGGETGFDTKETKLPIYWNTSFSKICLGMKIGQQINFIVINKQANSLYLLIADGQYRATSLGRNTWKTLIGSEASLQYKCNKEGFNANGTYSKARIGIVANKQSNCDNCNSRIGFGTGGNPDIYLTCGNAAKYDPDNGEKYIKAMGYILVQ
ncbi:hypothetical protein ACROYT_G033828 [Oculina patagonica]